MIIVSPLNALKHKENVPVMLLLFFIFDEHGRHRTSAARFGRSPFIGLR